MDDDDADDDDDDDDDADDDVDDDANVIAIYDEKFFKFCGHIKILVKYFTITFTNLKSLQWNLQDLLIQIRKVLFQLLGLSKFVTNLSLREQEQIKDENIYKIRIPGKNLKTDIIMKLVFFLSCLVAATLMFTHTCISFNP